VTGSAQWAPNEPASSGSVADLVEQLAATLANAAFSALEAKQEAREIVAALYDVPRFWPDTNAGSTVDAELWQRARAAAEKRALGAPLAYAVGRAAFRHLTLHVDERVLIPRPETELLVDLVLARASGDQELAVDVGTGSGAIALALASEGSFHEVLATDVSLDALAVARVNAELLEARGALRSRVSLAHGSLLAPLNARGQRANVVVSNPPYIAFHESRELPRDVRDWEPPVALFSGADGLDVSARLVRAAGEVLVPGGLLALEVDVRRASRVAEMVASDPRYHDVGVHVDLTGRERFVLAVRR
jgi:release factor glutamine methyltransferase